MGASLRRPACLAVAERARDMYGPVVVSADSFGTISSFITCQAGIVAAGWKNCRHCAHRVSIGAGDHFHPYRIPQDRYVIVITVRARLRPPEVRKSSNEGGNQLCGWSCGEESSADIDFDPGERLACLATGRLGERRSPRGILHKFSRGPRE